MSRGIGKNSQVIFPGVSRERMGILVSILSDVTTMHRESKRSAYGGHRGQASGPTKVFPALNLFSPFGSSVS